jgi:abequosyltransferase
MKLSFCIPTYNFGAFIGQTLASIIAQADEGVQIVIVDGGSTDNTAQVVAQAAAGFPGIKFLTQRQKGGVGPAILESVAAADGEYCWLFSSDDLLAPGAIAHVRAALDAGGWDLMLVGCTQCDRAMTPLWPHPILSARAPMTFDWSVPAQRADYGARARTTTAFFSYISDIIVRRYRWQAAEMAAAYQASPWTIAAKVYTMSRRGLVVRFDPMPLVLTRGDNDSFSARGMVWRVGLSLRGFRQMAAEFFGPASMEAAHVHRVLRYEYHFPGLLYRKLCVARLHDPQQLTALEELVRAHYDRPVAADRLRWFLYRAAPVGLLALLDAGYRLMRPLCRHLGH